MAGRSGSSGEKSGGSSGTLQIILAIITVSGVIATGLFTNWDKIFGRPAAASATPSADVAKPPVDLGPVLDPAAQKAAAEKLSSSQTKAYGAASGALDDVTRQIEGASPAPQTDITAQASVTGIWRDPDGYSFDVRQQGRTMSFQEYLNGTWVGSGNGTIENGNLRYGYATADDRGQCVARLSGNQISGRCQSEAGNSWPFTVTR